MVLVGENGSPQSEGIHHEGRNHLRRVDRQVAARPQEGSRQGPADQIGGARSGSGHRSEVDGSDPEGPASRRVGEDSETLRRGSRHEAVDQLHTGRLRPGFVREASVTGTASPGYGNKLPGNA